MSRVMMMPILFVVVVVCGSAMGASPGVKQALRTLPDSDERAQEADDRRGESLSDLQLLVPMVVVDDEGGPSQARTGGPRSDSSSSEEDERSSISLSKLVELLSGPGSQVTVPLPAHSHTHTPGTLAASLIVPADSEDITLEVDVNDKTCPQCLLLQTLKDLQNQEVVEQPHNRVGKRGSNRSQKSQRWDQNVQGLDQILQLFEQVDPRSVQKIPDLDQRGQRWDQKHQRDREDKIRKIQNYVQLSQLLDQQQKYWAGEGPQLDTDAQARAAVQIIDDMERRYRRSHNAPDVGPPPESSAPQSRGPTP